MKHVFRVSSHLTFYLSKKIIEVKQLKKEDCIFFLVRNYNIPTEYEKTFTNVIRTSYNVSSHQGRVFEGLNIIKTHKNIKEFDSLVDEFIKGESFIWYAQICNDDFCSLMVSKNNCAGYYIIEDGLGSYLHENKQTFTGWRYYVYKFFLKPLWPRVFEVKNNIIYTQSPKFKGCIATNKDCFPLHQQFLEVIGNPFEKINLKEPIDAILSIDPLYIWMSDSIVEKVYIDLAKIIKEKGYKHLSCKFHPYLDAKILSQQKETYRNIIKKNFPEIKFLDSNVVLENIFCTSQCDFITDHSSVCLYANKLGAKCYTIQPLIKKYIPTYAEDPVGKLYCLPII